MRHLNCDFDSRFHFLSRFPSGANPGSQGGSGPAQPTNRPDNGDDDLYS